MSVKWKPVLNYEEHYSASDLGEVVRTATQGAMRPRWKPLKAQLMHTGYLRFTLSAEGDRKDYSAHRLIWEAFNGPIPEGMQINHGNGIKTDNRLSNLEVCNQSQNITHAFRVLNVKPNINPSPGSKNGRAKLTESDIPSIREMLLAGFPKKDIAAKFNVSPALIWMIETGRNWRHVPAAS